MAQDSEIVLSQEPSSPRPSLRIQAVQGSGWMMAWRFSVRLLGMVNTFILVRLLTPADFGLYAMAMLVVQLVEVFGSTGQDLALIRIGRPTREHFDTAWTIQVIIYLFLALCLVAAAPFAGLYFHSAVVELLVMFLSLRLVATAFSNIGVVAFRINLDFAADFRLGVYQRVIITAASITAAVLLRDYWALAIAVVLARVVAAAMTYVMHPYRPRFSLAKAGELWNFSLWMWVVAISERFARRIDEFIVGYTNPPGVMGAYNVGADLATMPTVDLIEPTSRALFPLYSKVLGDAERLRDAVLMTIGATVTLCFSTGVGLAMVSHDFVPIFLGRDWTEAEPLMFWLALGACAIGINFSSYTILSVTGNAGMTAKTIWMRIALLIPCLTVAASYGGAVGIAAAQAAIGLFICCLNLRLVKNVVHLRLTELLLQLYRPVIATTAMAIIVGGLNHLMTTPSLVVLLLKVAAGAAAYISTLAMSWHFAGYPDGIEAVAASSAKKCIRACVSA